MRQSRQLVLETETNVKGGRGFDKKQVSDFSFAFFCFRKKNPRDFGGGERHEGVAQEY